MPKTTPCAGQDWGLDNVIILYCSVFKVYATIPPLGSQTICLLLVVLGNHAEIQKSRTVFIFQLSGFRGLKPESVKHTSPVISEGNILNTRFRALG